jgi:hypothetical protein
MFATLDKASPDAGNIRSLNLAAVKHATVQRDHIAVVTGATNDRA